GLENHIDLPLACLHNLENLQLYGGRLNSLDFLENMPKLRSIKLSCNFSRFPEGLGKLKHLEDISIFGAVSLKTLPKSIAELESLKRLRISASGVQTTPEFLKQREDMFIDIR
ncbi:MAG: hypothetical protein LBQ16_07280, partial [Gracilibacteraceae bacterium]|nr:hypothetical protein [Gracilibacteraceae bacterium]